jgi:hypothetical protein
MAASWTRPRAPGFAAFQNAMIELFADSPRWLAEPDRFLDDLDTLYARRDAA